MYYLDPLGNKSKTPNKTFTSNKMTPSQPKKPVYNPQESIKKKPKYKAYTGTYVLYIMIITYTCMIDPKSLVYNVCKVSGLETVQLDWIDR